MLFGNSSVFDSRLRAMIISHEGDLDFMYCDSMQPPVVTSAAGHAFFSADAATICRFMHTDGIAPASPAEIIDEWLRVRRLSIGPHQRHLASLFLPVTERQKLLDADLNRDTAVLRSEILGFDTLPDAARLGLYDVAYNQGSLRKWPKLLSAVAARNWGLAASECVREGIGEQRNKDTMALFLTCIKET